MRFQTFLKPQKGFNLSPEVSAGEERTQLLKLQLGLQKATEFLNKGSAFGWLENELISVPGS